MLVRRAPRVVVEPLDEAVGATQRDVVEARDGQAETLVRGRDEAFLCATTLPSKRVAYRWSSTTSRYTGNDGGGGGGGEGGINVDARDARETIEMDCQNSPFHRMRIHSCEMCSVNHFFDSSHCTMSTSSWPRKGSSLCQ